MERSEKWNICLNCIQILNVELTTGLEEKRNEERGSFDVISAASDAGLQNLASALHLLPEIETSKQFFVNLQPNNKSQFLAVGAGPNN